MATETDVAVLTAEFHDHMKQEDAWQKSMSDDMKEIKDILKPMVAQIQENTQTLYGVGSDKSNGLRGDMKKVHLWQDSVDSLKWKFLAICLAGELILTAGGFFAQRIWPVVHPQQDRTAEVK